MTDCLQQIKVISPGRVCLFGDHQDYLGLPVIACAIDRYIRLTATKNNKDIFCLDLVDLNQTREIDIQDKFEQLTTGDHYASGLRVLRRRGCIPTVGYDIHITGNIPINSGTSSSSAVLLAWIRFLIEAYGISEPLTPELIAYIAYEAEVLEHKSPGGMMDQYTIGVGNVVYITTDDPFSFEIIGTKVPGLITGVSGEKKDTLGLLAHLKKNTFLAIKKVSKKFLEFDLQKTEATQIHKYIGCLLEEEKPYFEAAIINHHCTRLALRALQCKEIDWKQVGALMNKHHRVLKDMLKITIPKIDAMIDAALQAGAYGAKIVGSGGGGSIVAIAPEELVDKINKAIISVGAVDSYAVSVSDGVKTI